MTTVAIQAWRTELILEVPGDINPGLLEGLLRQRVAAVDAAASRFRADSEVTRIGERAGQWVAVSPLTAALVRTAVSAADATDGIVHPGLGAAVIQAGYDDWAGQQTATAGSSQVLPWQQIELARDAVRIPPGMLLDLGATAKAWLADHLASVLHEATGEPVLANMGGDIRCISGTQPWSILLDGEHPAASPQSVTVHNAGVATSGRARRQWPGGHHIIDPRTGAPARTRWWSASVIASDAVGANAAATAAMVLSAEAPEWLARRGLSAQLVDEHGRVQQIRAEAAA